MNQLLRHEAEQANFNRLRMEILNPPPLVAARIALFRWFWNLSPDEKRRIEKEAAKRDHA